MALVPLKLLALGAFILHNCEPCCFCFGYGMVVCLEPLSSTLRDDCKSEFPVYGFSSVCFALYYYDHVIYY